MYHLSVHCCLVITGWERADLLALVDDVYCIFVTLPCGILCQVWYLIVSFPDLCCLSYFQKCIRMGLTRLFFFYFGRYIVGYTFENHVLRLRSRLAVNLNLRPHIRRYTSPNENFETPMLIYMRGLNLCLKFYL